MHRATLVLLVLLLAALPASAGWWPSFSPRTLQLEVGDQTSVEVHAVWSGLVDYGNGIHWTFRSDDSWVATANASVNDQGSHLVPIEAVGPGTARICLGNSGDSCYVTIFVRCGEEAPVRAAQPVLRAELHQPVTLSVVTPIAQRTHFTWFRGRMGDRSQPLDAASAEITFAPDAYDAQYVWVSAVTSCSTSSAEFRIDVPRPRQHAVRH
ncbi:MAG: hypothetical protein JO197_06120 [Acidobacteria bacterium]|nr:hypothetical protein [Acidobacteriota bacterium]MBV9070635.1 hypothetical protein [Acidobacteriota bacterium]MBV9478178.1 hypothetical protein [Acidobacteriota bacterium]